MELKHDKQTRGCWRFKELLIAPLMELKREKYKFSDNSIRFF